MIFLACSSSELGRRRFNGLVEFQKCWHRPAYVSKSYWEPWRLTDRRDFMWASIGAKVGLGFDMLRS